VKKSPYVADKTLDALSARWQTPLGKRQYLDIFVWETLDGMYDNCHFPNRGDYLGCYIGVPGRKKTGLFGEIHLVRSAIGGGCVAHEIAHAMLDWVSCRKWDDELFAHVTGKVTAAFWDTFYEKYKLSDN
jgi:hypothetical protein